MSYIFDALQRAEGQRDGTRAKGAAELLQRAEREAAIRRRAARGDREPAAQSGAIATSAPPYEGLILEITGEEATAKDLPSETVSDTASLENCGKLEVTLPKDSRLVCMSDKESPAAEAFRLLGVRLRHLRRERPLRTLLITSTIPQEGKSLTAANLACTLAAGTDEPVLLLEGDLRRPTLLDLFHTSAPRGLSAWLEGDRELKDCIWKIEGAGLWILPAAGRTEDPLGLMQSGRLQELMTQLRAFFPWIVVDAPPILPMADTSVWARLADGILLVARRGVTRRGYLKRGIEALDQQKLIGTVMNSATTASDHDYYYYDQRSEHEGS